jgi:hypothetical protein
MNKASFSKMVFVFPKLFQWPDVEHQIGHGLPDEHSEMDTQPVSGPEWLVRGRGHEHVSV